MSEPSYLQIINTKNITAFTPLTEIIDNDDLPKEFTFPFNYEPHPITIKAAEHLQTYLSKQEGKLNQYGKGLRNKPTNGKMFGVLVVKNENDELGYLSAYSGEIYEREEHTVFVPPIYDKFKADSYFLKESENITLLNKSISDLEQSETYLAIKDRLNQLKSANEQKLNIERTRKRKTRSKRRVDKNLAKESLDATAFDNLIAQQNQESINDKFYLKEYASYLESKILELQQSYDTLKGNIETLKSERKSKSITLQDWMFKQYNFLNAYGEEKNVRTIFKNVGIDIPPSGSGDCVAPKLLNFAYQNDFKPIAMAEFWWGISPRTVVRHQGYYYPACKSKCKPILGHMLQGLKVQPNPMLINPADGKGIEIIFEDDHIAIIHKPHEFLSVPGKNIEDSIYTRMKKKYVKATGPLIVHRLDMSTSGIMLIAKTKEAHQSLQKQFLKRTVKKTYVALLDGVLEGDSGSIELPLRVDLDNRPHQLVCQKHGKYALTKWELIDILNNQSLVRFFPITGRTHQLRVHAAHPLGLNTPIVGDDLYGKKKDRLYLHAESIEFNHPVSTKRCLYELPSGFES